MHIYIIYFTVVLIFLFLISLILKALNRGIKAKTKIQSNKKKSSDSDKKLKPTIVDEIEKLKKLKEDKTLSETEFKKAKNKLLNG